MNTNAWVAKVIALLEKRKEARLLVTIDGPCGSGKSTLASALSEALSAPVVHMDDYVIPHAQKTAERLAIPGGNADQERLLSEVIRPWLAGDTAIVRPYLCHEDRFGAGAPLPDSRLLILEGTYCHLPAISELAALRLFLTVDDVEQQNRLRQRVGDERLAAFNNRWIPLEKAYFSAYGLPDAGCMLIGSYDQSL